MNKIENKFKELNGKSAFIAYITSGHPTLAKTEELIYTLESNGADIIELGIPYSDPIADGPIIQAAGQKALDNGVKIKDIFATIKKVREKSQVPLALLVYYNSVYAFGHEKFVANCEEAGVDGLIIPDLPLEEQDELKTYLKGKNVGLIPLVAPNSGDRIAKVVEEGKGFVYCVSSLGVTGMRDSFETDLKEYLSSIRKHTDLPLAIGFGVSTNEDVKGFAKFADGIIVGSAIVQKVEETDGNIEKVASYIKELSAR